MYGDNKACLALCACHQATPMSRHTGIMHWWMSEKVQYKQLRFDYIPSAENVADMLTIALFKPAFKSLRKKMGLKKLELELEKKKSMIVLHIFIIMHQSIFELALS